MKKMEPSYQRSMVIVHGLSEQSICSNIKSNVIILVIDAGGSLLADSFSYNILPVDFSINIPDTAPGIKEISSAFVFIGLTKNNKSNGIKRNNFFIKSPYNNMHSFLIICFFKSQEVLFKIIFDIISIDGDENEF